MNPCTALQHCSPDTLGAHTLRSGASPFPPHDICWQQTPRLLETILRPPSCMSPGTCTCTCAHTPTRAHTPSHPGHSLPALLSPQLTALSPIRVISVSLMSSPPVPCYVTDSLGAGMFWSLTVEVPGTGINKSMSRLSGGWTDGWTDRRNDGWTQVFPPLTGRT